MTRTRRPLRDGLALLGLLGVVALALRRRRAKASSSQETKAIVESADPPLPDAAYRVVNPVVERFLRSPLHGAVGDSLTLITFTGRKTGREYTTPVGVHRTDDRLVVFTKSDWWKNLRGGQPVTVLLAGEERDAIATPTDDSEEVAKLVRQYLEAEGTARARRIGLRIESEEIPDEAALQVALEGTVAIKVEMAPDELEVSD